MEIMQLLVYVVPEEKHTQTTIKEFVAVGACSLSCCLGMRVTFHSTIQVSRGHLTLHSNVIRHDVLYAIQILSSTQSLVEGSTQSVLPRTSCFHLKTMKVG
jgi:hypothetical protein